MLPTDVVMWWILTNGGRTAYAAGAGLTSMKYDEADCLIVRIPAGARPLVEPRSRPDVRQPGIHEGPTRKPPREENGTLREAKPGKGGRDETITPWKPFVGDPVGNQSHPAEMASSRKRVLRE
jgi:hypothetical protein